MANPEHVELVKQGAEAIRQWREKNPDVRLDLGGADLGGADLRGSSLHLTNLAEANLAGTNIAQADVREANLSRANLHELRGAHQVRGLETVRLSEGPAHYFETCKRPWPEHVVDWERLRVAGRLLLFGVSYTALILIPIVFYGLALYNDKVDLVRTWAEQVTALPDHPMQRLAPLILERLHPRPIPSQSFLLLLSTLLLAVGSTLYTFFSPSRVKEFSLDQWRDQLGRSLLHYWPLAWEHRYIRLACAVCYALGGIGALWVLGTKVWHTALFILKHSTFPWLQR